MWGDLGGLAGSRSMGWGSMGRGCLGVDFAIDNFPGKAVLVNFFGKSFLVTGKLDGAFHVAEQAHTPSPTSLVQFRISQASKKRSSSVQSKISQVQPKLWVGGVWAI